MLMWYCFFTVSVWMMKRHVICLWVNGFERVIVHKRNVSNISEWKDPEVGKGGQSFGK